MKVLLSFLLLGQLSFASTLSYYPTQIKKDLAQGNIQDKELIRILNKTLTASHQRTLGGDDYLGCSKERKGECYTQRSNTYKEAKHFLFKTLHLEKDEDGKDFVRDVYCHKYFSDRYNQRSKPKSRQSLVNCEHTWPQSKFSGNYNHAIQKGDLHHLYPTDTRANSKRSSHDFGIVTNGNQAAQNCEASQYANRTFQPPAEHRGNVARAMFYFSVRYTARIHEKMERVFRLWNEQDPIDAEEIKRNEMIYQIQGNRNPFIDFPHLADSINDF